MYSAELLKEVLKFWAFDMRRICPEIDIAGSPERCDFRMVIEDNMETLTLSTSSGRKTGSMRLSIGSSQDTNLKFKTLVKSWNI
jgi:hypothetical protein